METVLHQRLKAILEKMLNDILEAPRFGSELDIW